ncbi:class II fumarate hydratase [Erysipelothrix sp. HDW6C]|uniref:class II fumarate hydratase n=1 Tax=Erysipelothrix sp. HDW6C TaxID=2714930 RepID=UPI00140C3CC0|nr:class II fumarate hydratase [Erysipelothrix sp. HDW6C]QIK68956.1 class II fumarate hydratase [Erysipelothrix sp. HDW6C]
MASVKDIYGEVTIDDGALWGANTQRSIENFPVGIEKMPVDLIKALLELKRACAVANKKQQKLAPEKADAIIASIDSLLAEDFYRHFPLAIWQTGSGTQTNMNANEVIANHANQAVGEKLIHPNDDVNMGQSSNDVFPTAMHIMATTMLANGLIPELRNIENTLLKMESQYMEVLKTGRTHLQDATPITFGQEVSGWRMMFTEGIQQTEDTLKYLRKLAMGATAVGTGLNTYSGFDQDVTDALNARLHLDFTPSENKFHAISTKDSFVFSHGAINTIATNTLKMVNDIRLLASGPRVGLGEINLPANEAGSSIMPGKVNPTQAESLAMVCVQVMANNQSISIGSSLGNFQLNAYMPLIANAFWQSVRLLSDGMNSFDTRCLRGITLNKDKMRYNLTTSLMTATYLNQKFGYDQTALIVKEAHDRGISIKEVVVGLGLMSSEDFDLFFDYEAMVKPEKQ